MKADLKFLFTALLIQLGTACIVKDGVFPLILGGLCMGAAWIYHDINFTLRTPPSKEETE